ncbi:type II toxin-antitoxin system PemK/MazF family toxin [Bifidobacterium platyrrhinorum]|uniref:Type II toxin-antitoxin system PemK/MazF family toxin n=1 Tax=Bifidobacterium platyrrhinorum TaxID=2661628 RepID=A0A6L9SQN7_9BIFI|nr:type II toxin-antitoxin system PemK/MazF family toxin [Bifidobacterium platyrrhinorum]NEG54877.1 type II toxin-antitoxin system PemK/MazF family toxin [Bifidobacterium platyrrhinorum]
MRYEQGDIILLDFNPSRGHEPKKTRPALVVSKSSFNKATSMTLVCPITSTDNGFFLHERLPEYCRTQGWVIMEQVSAKDVEARESQLIEHLPDTAMQPILDAIRTFC